MESLKSSMMIKSGKKGRMSSILRRGVISRKFMALYLSVNASEPFPIRREDHYNAPTHLLISFFSCTTYFAIFNHNFFLNASSSSGFSAFIFANSRSPFSSARSTLASYNPILE